MPQALHASFCAAIKVHRGLGQAAHPFGNVKIQRLVGQIARRRWDGRNGFEVPDTQPTFFHLFAKARENFRQIFHVERQVVGVHQGGAFKRVKRQRIGHLCCGNLLLMGVAALRVDRLTRPLSSGFHHSNVWIAVEDHQLIAVFPERLVQGHHALCHEPGAVLTHAFGASAPAVGCGHHKSKNRLVRVRAQGRQGRIVFQPHVFSKPIQRSHHNSSIRFKFISAVSSSACCFSGAILSHVR